MPTLDWIGKQAVVGHHRRVPYRLLHCDRALSAGDPDAGNLLVQGDNLEALKALLPYYAGQVKCIYIDPPYNTGNEGWIYNDNVNSPEIRRWLGDTVGKEAEDLSRHDKWLCMMYPRLMLLKEFLSEDGAIFVSIDDREAHHLRCLLDEVFGARNFIANVVWQKMDSPKNTAIHLSEDHDYITIFAKDASVWRPNPLPRTEAMTARYKNPDDDPRGPWLLSDLAARNFYAEGRYSITTPKGKVIDGPPAGSYWRVSLPRFRELEADNRIWWGKSQNNRPGIKRFLSEVRDGVVPQTLWMWKDAGSTRHAKQELSKIMGAKASSDLFITPKPVQLIDRILHIATDADSLVMDSFAGSATTGHAVLAKNKADGGTRRCILVEMDHEVSEQVAAVRMGRVIEGYTHSKGEKTEDIDGTGGGLRFCRLGKPLFDEHGDIAEEVTFADLARHVFFTETGSPMPKEPRKNNPLLGAFEDRAIYLLFNGVLGDKRPDGGNVLTAAVLAELPEPPASAVDAAGGGRPTRVVYGEGCRLGAARLKREGVVFKQVPYEVKVS